MTIIRPIKYLGEKIMESGYIVTSKKNFVGKGNFSVSDTGVRKYRQFDRVLQGPRQLSIKMFYLIFLED